MSSSQSLRTAPGVAAPVLVVAVVAQVGGPVGTWQWVLRVIATGMGLFFVLLGGAYVRAGRRIRRGARMDAATVTPIVDLAPGDALVSGTARPIDGTLEAPLTGTVGLAACAEASGPRHYHGVGGGWMHRTHARKQVIAPFRVTDGSGTVRVDPPTSGALDLELDPVASALLSDQRGRWSVFWTPAGMPHVERLLALHEQTDELDDDPFRAVGPFTFGSVPRYVEGVVEPGDEVYVQGRVVEASGAAGGELSVTGDSKRAFVLSDRPPGQRTAAVLRRGRKRYYSGGVSMLVGGIILVGTWLLL